MTDSTEPKKPRGLAALSKERRSEIARLGGKASGGNFRNDPERAALMGRKSKRGIKKHENQT